MNKNNICSIYKIINLINSKVYIGQTWNTIQYRFTKHKQPAQKRCVKLHRAFNKHGRHNFKIELLTFTHTQKLANFYEIYFINYYDSINVGYNSRGGGSRGSLSDEAKRNLSESRKGSGNPMYGKHLSEQHKMLLSEANKNQNNRLGCKLSEEHKQALINANTGSTHSEATKLKISKALKGKLIPEETKHKISETKKSKSKITQEIVNKIRHEINGNMTQEELAKKYNISRSSVGNIISNNKLNNWVK